MPNMDRITLVIKWAGAQKALLYYVIDNGNVIDVSSQRAERHGEISITYDAEASAAHHIEWSLMFPAKTLGDLHASARLEGSTTTSSKKANGNQKHHWVEDLSL